MEPLSYPTWWDIALRLTLTMIAGIAIGINRGSRGQAAGLRTTILVGLAASVAMIQANILLFTSGKTPSSFAAIDPMRLSLGILTGVGFIGGGCILKRGELVTGVTTAATLWAITVIGLCFGGGQLILGSIAIILAITTLWVLKWVDVRIPRNHRAHVLISTSDPQSLSNLKSLIEPHGYHARFMHQINDDKLAEMAFEIHWLKSDKDVQPLNLLHLLEKHYTIKSFELTAEKTDHGL